MAKWQEGAEERQDPDAGRIPAVGTIQANTRHLLVNVCARLLQPTGINFNCY